MTTTTTKRRIFFVFKKKSDRAKKKSFLCPFLSTLCLSPVSTPSLFFVHSGFLRIKEKEGTFLYTRTRAQKKNVFSESFFKERERERKKKSMGKKEVRRFVSFRYNRKGRVKKTFALSEMMRSAHFFLTYSFRGHPCFERMTMSRVEDYNNNNNTLFVAKRESSSVRLLKNSFPSFYRSSSPPRSKEVFVFVLKEKLTKSGVRFIFFFPTTLFHQTEAKNEQTRRG